MEDVIIKKEDLSDTDAGGGLRHTTTEITIDKTVPLYQQRIALVYELLSAMLDAIVTHEKLLSMAHTIGDALQELESGGE